ncbi:MAG: hypothetical protein K0U60_01165 [Actinomycetia bacterium]|nr:hypothetical protein [Actinomycetes bacterium]MCH9800619.1 hypothetical protein [Actinomycetes bacterium]
MSRLLQTIPEISVSQGKCALPPGVANTGDVSATGQGAPQQGLAGWRHQGAHTALFTDSDAANGTGDNIAVISDASHHGGGKVKTIYRGGVHDDESLRRVLSSGVSRIVLDVGDAADRDWAKDTLTHQQQRVIAGISIHGSDAINSAGDRVADLFDLIEELQQHGTPALLISETSGHDRWFHRDRHVLTAVCESAKGQVFAQGAVKHDSDIHALAPLVQQGLAGVVVGEPLYRGAFTFQEAITAAEARYDPYEWGPPQP